MGERCCCCCMVWSGLAGPSACVRRVRYPTARRLSLLGFRPRTWAPSTSASGPLKCQASPIYNSLSGPYHQSFRFSLWGGLRSPHGHLASWMGKTFCIAIPKWKHTLELDLYLSHFVLPPSQNIASFRLFQSQTFSTLTMNNEIIINANNINMISVDLLGNELSNYVIFSIWNKLF
jgi:hypothetical protein